jgi:hypothetical protein
VKLEQFWLVSLRRHLGLGVRRLEAAILSGETGGEELSQALRH